MLRYLLLCIPFVLFISGCAPQYAVKNIYIPPVGQKAKQCINECTNTRNECQSKCDLQYNQCINDAYERAKDIKALEDIEYKKRYNIYKIAMDKYRLKLYNWQNQYDSSYKDYNYFLDKCRKKDSYACDRQRELRYTLDKLSRIKPIHPKIPYKKSFEVIYDNEKRGCKNECGCQKDYDICFLNCGGEIQIKKICIENCKQ